MKKLSVVASFLASFLVLSQTALAHVVVKPGDALTSAFQTFTMSVPTEKEMSTIKLKLVIPESLQYVTPSVKPGWTITPEKQGEGETAKTVSITWEGGAIPAHFRDDFSFSAKTPDTAGDLQWKAYQTYEDGTVVAWDQDPAMAKGGEEATPFSVTKVTAKPASTNDSQLAAPNSSDTSYKTISFVALALSVIAIALATRQANAKRK